MEKREHAGAMHQRFGGVVCGMRYQEPEKRDKTEYTEDEANQSDGKSGERPTVQIAKNRNSRIAVIVNDMSASGSGIGRHHISARPIIK